MNLNQVRRLVSKDRLQGFKFDYLYIIPFTCELKYKVSSKNKRPLNFWSNLLNTPQLQIKVNILWFI